MRYKYHRWIVLLVLLAISIFRVPPTVQAQTLLVNSEATLAQAIRDANATPALDTIELTANIFLYTTTPVDLTGLPRITEPLIIKGNNHTIRRASATPFRLLQARDTHLWLEDITLANGYVPIWALGGDATAAYGGAVYVSGTDSSLTLVRTIVGGSVANRNTASYAAGGVYALELYASDSTISHNQIQANNAEGAAATGAGAFILGRTTLVNSTISDNSVVVLTDISEIEYSSAIGIYAANPLFINATIARNTLTSGNAPLILGAGAYLNAPDDISTVINSTFDSNSVSGSVVGGGGFAYLGRLYMNASSVINNHVSGTRAGSAGIYNDYGVGQLPSIIENSVFSGNITQGIHTAGATVYIEGIDSLLRNVTIDNNRVTLTAPNADPTYGANSSALLLGRTNSHLENVTITNNVIEVNNPNNSHGSTVDVNGTATFNNVTIADNEIIIDSLLSWGTSAGVAIIGGTIIDYYYVGQLTLNNSIIARNRYRLPDGSDSRPSNCYVGEDYNGNAFGFVGSYNLIDYFTGCEQLSGTSNTTTGNFSLVPLADNGGLTPTRAIAGIPPINSGNPTTCAATDQRGAPRDASCDIGAFESGATVPASNQSPTIIGESFRTVAGAPVDSFSVAINDSDPEGDQLYYVLVSPATNGWTTMARDGYFVYTPHAGYIGDDSFQYIACDTFGNCSAETQVNISLVASDVLPDAPTNLNTTAFDNLSISLAWDDNADDETSYILERLTVDETGWQRIATLPADTTSYTDNTPECNTAYQYRIRAYRDTDNAYSLLSDVHDQTTALCAGPTNFVAIVRDENADPLRTTRYRVRLTWDDSVVDAESYRYTLSRNGSEPIVYAFNISPPVENIDGMYCNGTYTFGLYAVFEDESTSEIVYQTVAMPDCPPPPDAPTNLAIGYATSIYMNLDWTDNSDTATGFRVERSTDGGTTWERAPSYNYYTLRVDCTVEAQYRVIALLDHIASTPSDVLTFQPVCAPTNVSESRSLDTVTLTWTDVATNETGYEILHGTNYSESVALPANTTSYTFTGLPCGTSYNYQLRAVGSSTGVYSDTETLSVSTLDCPPNAPSNIAVTRLEAANVRITWQDNADNESHYRITRSSDGGATWTFVRHVPANATTYTDNGLCNVTYIYRVFAGGFTGSYSVPAESVPLTLDCIPTATPTHTPTITPTPSNTPIPRQPNDDIETATLINSLPFVANQPTLYARLEAGDPQPSCDATIDKTLWYQLTPSTSNTYQVHTMGSDHDLALAIYTGTPDNLTELACDTRSAPGGQALVRMPMLAGTTYYLMLGTSTNATGMAQVTVQQIASPTATPLPTNTAIPTSTPIPLTTTVGLYDAQTSLWQFRESNATGTADVVFHWAVDGAGWQAIIGDWNGNGEDGIGLYRDGIWLLRNTATIGDAHIQINFGLREAGWQAIVGDWNGDGQDDFGLYKDGQFMLADGPDATNIQIVFFDPLAQGGTPIAGDWDGYNGDTIGLYNAGQWILADANVSNSSANIFSYGEPDWLPVVGDWNEDGIDTIGGYRNGRWYLRDSNNAGAPSNAFAFDGVGVPLASYRGGLPALTTLSNNMAISPTTVPIVPSASATSASPTPSPTVSPTATPSLTAPLTATAPQAEATAEPTSP